MQKWKNMACMAVLVLASWLVCSIVADENVRHTLNLFDPVLYADLEMSGDNAWDIGQTAKRVAAIYLNTLSFTNDETIANSTDSEFTLTADDDAATLAILRLKSDNAAANIAAADVFKVLFSAANDSNEVIDYVSIIPTIDDNATNSEDSSILFKVQVAGTETTAATLSGDGFSQADLIATDDLTVGDDSQLTGDLAVGGALSVTGAVTFGSVTAAGAAEYVVVWTNCPAAIGDTNSPVFVTAWYGTNKYLLPLIPLTDW